MLRHYQRTGSDRGAHVPHPRAVTVTDTGGYGRTVRETILADARKRNQGGVRAGLAWWGRPNDPGCRTGAGEEIPLP